MKITTWNQDGLQYCNAEKLPQRLMSSDTTVWVDVTYNEEEAKHILDGVFHFHPLAIEDTRNERQRPKVEEYGGYLFLIINSVAAVKGALEFHEVNAFIGGNYLVTVHDSVEGTPGEMQLRLERLDRRPAMSSGFLLYLLLDVVVDSYFPILDALGERIEELEERVLNNPQRTVLDELFGLRHDVTELWRVINHQRNMFSVLSHHGSIFEKNEILQYYLRDVYDHLIVISDTINTYRDLLTGMVELYMSSVSNRLNIVVTRLTVYTLVIGALTVLSGFYGMNFSHGEAFWPPLPSEWGVGGVILLMVGVVAGMLLLFRWLKWLD